jgi:osmoprotectant transport system permease protein
MAMPQLLVGAIPVTLLSLSTDFLFGSLERRLTPQGMRG